MEIRHKDLASHLAKSLAPIDPADEPMNRTVCSGSQNDAIRPPSSFEVGRMPSRRRSGTRSIHLPTFVSSIGAAGIGTGSSTT
jgi:hypothetical protein